MISKDDFLKRSSLKRKDISISIGDIEVVELDLNARGKLMELSSGGNSAAIGSLILGSCVPVLADATEAEIAAISPSVSAEITEAVFALSGIGDAASDDAKKN